MFSFTTPSAVTFTTLLSVSPTVSPRLFLTVNAPDVASSESLARNCAAVLEILLLSTSADVLAAVPANTKSASTVLNPLTTSPTKLGIVSTFCGVNAILLHSPTNVPPTQYFTIVLLVPVLSSTVITSGPDFPWNAL